MKRLCFDGRDGQAESTMTNKNHLVEVNLILLKHLILIYELSKRNNESTPKKVLRLVGTLFLDEPATSAYIGGRFSQKANLVRENKYSAVMTQLK